jgi:hypothetical protein
MTTRPAHRESELQFLLAFIIAIFIHMVMFVGIVAPRMQSLWEVQGLTDRLFRNEGSGRDIIVNINQDDKKVVVKETLLSDRDSSAKGFITKKPGDRWLNNSLDFRLLRGNRGRGGPEDAAVRGDKSRMLSSDESEMVVTLDKSASGGGEEGNHGIFDKSLIPDRFNVTKENAIFYSNDGRFSYNTLKFKNFKFFRELKDKIASNWHPPLMANAVLNGYNPVTGGYTPGYTRIMLIPSQEVVTVFVLDRNGEVIQAKLLDSMGNKFLDKACMDAITLSKNFGKVPTELLQQGGVLVIPFIFGYYVN